MKIGVCISGVIEVIGIEEIVRFIRNLLYVKKSRSDRKTWGKHSTNSSYGGNVRIVIIAN